MNQTTETLASQPELFELPASDVVCKEILESLRPLRDDKRYRECFYGEMGVVRTELAEGQAIAGQRVLYKDERQQLSGSYKSRGASHAILQSPAERYVTNSTGNHGRSVGIAAARVGSVAEVEGTKSMSPVKVAGIASTGAVLRQHADFRQAELAAETAGEEDGAVWIPPFGSADVLAGQCTLGDELVEDLITRGLANETVVIPVSVAGGGHITGVALPVWEAKQAGRLGPNVQVVAVQPKGGDTMNRALAKVNAGLTPANLYAYDTQNKYCDALAIGEESLNPATMAIVNDSELVAGFYTLEEAEIGRSMAELDAELGGTVEPASALGHAFAKKYAETLSAAGESAVFLLPISGGNRSEATSHHYQAAVARDDFRHQSHNYAMRSMSPFEEIAGFDRSEFDDKAIRDFACAALSGFTARYRSPLVTPHGRS